MKEKWAQSIYMVNKYYNELTWLTELDNQSISDIVHQRNRISV